jgi:hypothetical protein
MLGCAADIIAGNRADHRRLFCLIVKMHQEGRIKFSQLIWGGAKGAPLATWKIYLPKGVPLAALTGVGFTSRMCRVTCGVR